MERELDFLDRLRRELLSRFGDEAGGYLFGVAGAEFLSGPHGVSAMFDAEAKASPRTKN